MSRKIIRIITRRSDSSFLQKFQSIRRDYHKYKIIIALFSDTFQCTSLILLDLSDITSNIRTTSRPVLLSTLSALHTEFVRMSMIRPHTIFHMPSSNASSAIGVKRCCAAAMLFYILTNVVYFSKMYYHTKFQVVTV